MSNTPSDEELNSVLCHHWPAFSMQAVLVQMWLRDAMRAALAKWGTPQPVVREPLTPEQVSEIADAAHREYDRLVASGQCAPRWSAVFAYLLEQAHGITQKGGQHGTDN